MAGKLGRAGRGNSREGDPPPNVPKNAVSHLAGAKSGGSAQKQHNTTKKKMMLALARSDDLERART